MTMPTRRMDTLGRRLRAGVAIAAGCLLGAAHAAKWRGGDEAGPDYVPAPRSALVGRQDLPFRLAQEQRGESTVTILAWQAAGGQAVPLSVMALSRSRNGTRLSVQRLALPDLAKKEGGDLDVATLEYLYTLVLRQDPEAQYCLADVGQGCDADPYPYSHAGMLLQLARARQHAVDSAGRPGASVPWQLMSLAPTEMPDTDPDEVGIRISGEQGPMAGLTIFFNQAPHASCAAQSTADGLATCHLVDQHGDDDAHGHSKAPVLALFPGDIRADRVLLPTTLVLNAKP